MSDVIKVRVKEENVIKVKVQEFVFVHSNLPSTSKPVKLQEKAIQIVENGTIEIAPDETFDGLKKVDVVVEVPSKEPVLQEKSVDITNNGTTDITADDGYDGLKSVSVNVDVAGESGEDLLTARFNNTLTAYHNDDLTSIPEHSFYKCTSLEDISMPELTNIGPDSFNGCSSLKTAYLPKVQSCPTRIFRDCTSLEKVVTSAASFSSYAFYNCSSLSELTYGTINSTLGTYAFYNTPSLKIDFDASLSGGQVPAYVFYHSGIKSFKADRTTGIANNAFEGCENLTRISIGSDSNSKSSIAANSMKDCINLSTFIVGYKSSPITLSNANAFLNTPIESGTGFIYVLDELVDDYKSATNWSTYAAQIKPLSELPE